jgi:phosphodiesterase/alkaline phosphatase D-like protein
MTRVRAKLAIMAVVGGLLFSHSIAAQDGVLHNPYNPKILPPAQKAAHVEITQGPALESARTNSAIIAWTTKNPGGTDEHFGIVHYGTDPIGLSQTSKSPIRLNRYHSDAIFRVRVEGLTPQTKYYYTVESMGSTGVDDGAKSDIQQFSTR